jgi:hypothetical protein
LLGGTHDLSRVAPGRTPARGTHACESQFRSPLACLTSRSQPSRPPSQRCSRIASASQINRATVLLQLVPVGNGPGKNLTWGGAVRHRRSARRSPTARTSAAFNNDDKVPATLDYGTYHDAFAVTGKALAAAANTRNPDELADLFGDELGDSVERLAKGISQALYTGDGSTDAIMGLCDNTAGAILDTGIYATINRVVEARSGPRTSTATAASAAR